MYFKLNLTLQNCYIHPLLIYYIFSLCETFNNNLELISLLLKKYDDFF